MARTAIAVQSSQQYQQGISGGGSYTNADSANGHSITPAGSDQLVLLAFNDDASPHTLTITKAANARTYNDGSTISITLPAAAGGRAGVQVIYLDNLRALLQSDGTIYLDIDDDTSTYFAVVKPTPTPF